MERLPAMARFLARATRRVEGLELLQLFGALAPDALHAAVRLARSTGGYCLSKIGRTI